MSDERWAEVDQDIASATRHFSAAVRLNAEEPVGEDTWEGYKARMSLMHAMQAGHTSLETALLRILDMLGEQRPSGESWHADLIRRASRASNTRPVILPPDLAKAADRTRRFRHVAVRTDDQFEHEEAITAIDAAGILATALQLAVTRFRSAIGG